MIKMVYPEPQFSVRKSGDREEIFDAWRRAWVRLTPEEWVRQNILRWLTGAQAYPAGMMAVEKELIVGVMKKRFDILVFDPGHRPWMLVECKAPEVELSEKTLMQVLRYNMKVKASYLVITNGHRCFAADIRAQPAIWISEMPAYPAGGTDQPR
jgi:hypothetical protein